ncbi:MAG: hypothetical protein INQ03_23515 [Candidatus Heimdallarchaeota archaeon]|nr:hypothetical protein [Candidatus Heimdallarchaeota archaeon]
MLDVHFFGTLRKYSEFKGVTDDSVVYVDYKEGETIAELLKRMGVVEEVGEVFINHLVKDLDDIIESDGSRIAVFEDRMRLLCGGQHLKGHGYITKKDHKKQNYW